MFLHAHNKAGHNPCAPSSFLLRFRWNTKHELITIPATFKVFPYEVRPLEGGG